MSDEATGPEIEPDPEAEQPVPRWNPKNDPDGIRRRDLRENDWILNTLLDLTVDLGSSTENNIGLSVTVGGTLVSGTVIHRDKWAELLVEQMSGAAGQGTDITPITEALGKMIRQGHDDYAEMAARRDEQDLPNPARRFLHFRDARVHTPGQWQDSALWRVQVLEITGWSLGRHEPEDSLIERDR